MTERSGSTSIPSTVELRLIIGMLTLIIKIGRYLPHTMFTFATINLILGVFDFTIWGNLLFGVVNTMLAVGGFVLTGQLLQGRIINRSRNHTRGRDPAVMERAGVQPKINAATINESEVRDLEAA